MPEAGQEEWLIAQQLGHELFVRTKDLSGPDAIVEMKQWEREHLPSAGRALMSLAYLFFNSEAEGAKGAVQVKKPVRRSSKKKEAASTVGPDCYDISDLGEDVLLPPAPSDKQKNLIVCRQRLAAFLGNAFSVSELQQLIRHNVLLAELFLAINWNRSPLDIAVELVEKLENRNLIGDEFFKLLKAERDQRISEIEQLHGICTVVVPGSSATTPSKDSGQNGMSSTDDICAPG
jgi:hypothetical protein